MHAKARDSLTFMVGWGVGACDVCLIFFFSKTKSKSCAANDPLAFGRKGLCRCVESENIIVAMDMSWLPFLLLFIVPAGAFVSRQAEQLSDMKRPVVVDEVSSRVSSSSLRIRRALGIRAQNALASDTEDFIGTIQILPAKRPLHSFFTNDHNDNTKNQFSILSWNILLPNSQDNWWNHKMYSSWVPMDKREWSHRQNLIRERLLLSEADIICIQEADGNTFEQDFAFMKRAGYEHCLHRKFRFRCATFFKSDKFVLEQEAHKDRALVTALRSVDEKHLLNVVNCHLSGGAAPERRLRQVYEALEQIRKWKNKVIMAFEKQQNANRPIPKNIEQAKYDLQLQENAGVVVCGDFNSDGNTGVRKLLVEGKINPEWREPQYPDISLTSKCKEHSYSFLDAAELAHGANVCDGDYGERPGFGCRPATYVVPNLASLLVFPNEGEGIPRTEFGLQVAQGLANTLGLQEFCENEIDRAFESIDLDGNNIIDEDEVQKLLDTVCVNTLGKPIEEEDRRKFFNDFWGSASDQNTLTREQLTEKLMALQQELKGGSEGAELVDIRTKADAQRMIARFTPVLQDALDYVFDKFSCDGGDTLTEEEVTKFLIKANGELGRGGTWRHTSAILKKKIESSEPAVLTRQEWYEVFARELGEGKWWQVVYDLEVCGANLRSQVKSEGQHYQGWLDYLYFDSRQIACIGVQEALADDEHSRIYDDGDALPNEWHPSDHLPVAAVFSWQ